MKSKKRFFYWHRHVFALVFLLLLFQQTALSQGTAFTYQGRLTDSGNPANGSYDLQFALFDSLNGGMQVGSTLTRAGTSVSGGTFTVVLDFGVNAFSGAPRFLEIGVRPGGSPSAFAVLVPRQQITSSPYAIQTLNATQLGGVPASQYVQTNDARLSDARIPLPNSTNYVQNTTTQQALSNFNISGNGTVGTLNVNGAVSVGGNAAPPLAPTGQGRLYFDSTVNKFRISESNGAFVNLVGSGGVSGSGITNTIPLWSAGTTLGNSLISQFGTNVGIGTSSPAHRLAAIGGPCWTGDCWGGSLELENASAIAWRQNTSGVKFGIGRTENGLFFFRTLSPLGTTTSGPIYDFKMDNSGNVGIGSIGISTDLSARLNLFTSGFGLEQTDGTVRVGSYIGSGGGWFGTRSNHPLHFYTNNSSPLMTVATSGNVGIGVTSLTNARLDVDAGTNSFAIYSRGGVGQNASSYGLPKFMLLVRNNGISSQATIEKCYNAVSGTSTVPCGILSINQPGGAGLIYIRFPFRVTDRFFSITPLYSSLLPSHSQVVGFDSSDLSGQTLTVYAAGFQADEADFYLIVY